MVSNPESNPDRPRLTVRLPLIAVIANGDPFFPITTDSRACGKAQPNGAFLHGGDPLRQSLGREAPGQHRHDQQDLEAQPHAYGCSMMS